MVYYLRISEKSDFLGPVKMTVTIIHAGSQHNVESSTVVNLQLISVPTSFIPTKSCTN